MRPSAAAAAGAVVAVWAPMVIAAVFTIRYLRLQRRMREHGMSFGQHEEDSGLARDVRHVLGSDEAAIDHLKHRTRGDRR